MKFKARGLGTGWGTRVFLKRPEVEAILGCRGQHDKVKGHPGSRTEEGCWTRYVSKGFYTVGPWCKAGWP